MYVETEAFGMHPLTVKLSYIWLHWNEHDTYMQF